MDTQEGAILSFGNLIPMSQLDQHIGILCSELGIIRIVKEGRGRARVNMRVIRHPPITEEMAYFVALHEIGHCVVGLAGTRLEREAACWRWALDNAIRPAHYSTRQRITACLVRYLYRAEARDWEIPKEGDFWELMKWWEGETPDTVWKRNWGLFRQKLRQLSASDPA